MVNIAEILKNAPEGLKLYSRVHGEVELGSVFICTDYPIMLKPFDSNDEYYDKYGKLYTKCGEPILFPSKDHQTWDNWQKVLIPKCVGSVIVTINCICDYEWIVTKSGMFAINMNEDETYMHPFNAMCYNDMVFANSTETEVFFKRLCKLGYKFENGEVVKKEEKKWSILDAKDGDFIFDIDNEGIFIFKGFDEDRILRYASYIDDYVYKEPDGHYSTFEEGSEMFRPATNYEEDLLIDKLFEAGYRWDADKKVVEIVGVKENENPEKKFTIEDFKPFDKVLVRDRSEQYWNINLFSYYEGTSDYPYKCLSCDFAQCVPYNEETAHLLGTNKEYNGKYKTWED